jgi:nucleotide-binding universal stress UspA family protein
MTRHIVVGTDRSPQAATATRWASELADATGSALMLVHAYLPDQAERIDQQTRALHREAADRLRAWARHLGLTPEPSTVAVEGAPEHVLPEAAQQRDAELVVIGSRPFEGITRLGLGSLAHRLVNRVERPLIVVPDGPPKLRGGWFVVDGNGSAASEVAVRWSEELAARIDADVCKVRHTAGDPARSLQALAAKRGGGLIVVSAGDGHRPSSHRIGALVDHLLHHPVHPVAVLPHDFGRAAA